MKINIITIFPNFFESVFTQTIIKRAQEKNKLELTIHNLRKWTSDRHQTVDDTPYGGGAGLVMKVEPFYKAFKELGITKSQENKKVIALSPRGKTWTQNVVKEYAKLTDITLICGRYEGIDQRVIENLCDEEISVGDFVLSGGEVAAIVVVDTLARLLPGVLGNDESINDESFSNGKLLEYPHYTKPSIFKTDEGEEWKIPEILLTGNHQEIDKWRREQMKMKSE